MREWLRPGSVRLWEDARTISKEPGAPVLYLQLGERGPRWEGAGRVVEVEERWKSFGVYVRCTKVLPRGIHAVPRIPDPAASKGTPARTSYPAEEAWENRSLASLLGLHRFQTRTPFLDEGRDLRLTGSDLRLLVDLQPGLAQLIPP